MPIHVNIILQLLAFFLSFISGDASLIIVVDARRLLRGVFHADNVVDLADRTGDNLSDPYLACCTW